MPARPAEVLGRRRVVSVSRRDDETAHRTARHPETTRGIAPYKTGGSVMMRTFRQTEREGVLRAMRLPAERLAVLLLETAEHLFHYPATSCFSAKKCLTADDADNADQRAMRGPHLLQSIRAISVIRGWILPWSNPCLRLAVN
jgi:hypothetical protein